MLNFIVCASKTSLCKNVLRKSFRLFASKVIESHNVNILMAVDIYPIKNKQLHVIQVLFFSLCPIASRSLK